MAKMKSKVWLKICAVLAMVLPIIILFLCAVLSIAAEQKHNQLSKSTSAIKYVHIPEGMPQALSFLKFLNGNSFIWFLAGGMITLVGIYIFRKSIKGLIAYSLITSFLIYGIITWALSKTLWVLTQLK